MPDRGLHCHGPARTRRFDVVDERIQFATLGGVAKSPIKGRLVLRAPCRTND